MAPIWDEKQKWTGQTPSKNDWGKGYEVAAKKERHW